MFNYGTLLRDLSDAAMQFKSNSSKLKALSEAMESEYRPRPVHKTLGTVSLNTDLAAGE